MTKEDFVAAIEAMTALELQELTDIIEERLGLVQKEIKELEDEKTVEGC